MILRVAKRIFLPIAFAFLAWFAWESRELLVDVVRSAKPVKLAIAVIAWMSMHAFSLLFYKKRARCGREISTSKTAAIMHASTSRR